MSDEMILTAVNRNPSVPINETLGTVNTNLNTRLTVARGNNLDTIPTINTNVNTLLSRVPTGSGFSRVIRGSTVLAGGGTNITTNVTIASVNTSRAFIVITNINDSSAEFSNFIARTILSSATQLQIIWGGTGNAATQRHIVWQVIELN